MSSNADNADERGFSRLRRQDIKRKSLAEGKLKTAFIRVVCVHPRCYSCRSMYAKGVKA